MRKINFTIEIPDDDFTEHKAILAIENTFGAYLKDLRKFPNVDHLKEDKTYDKLKKAKIKSGKELDNYINNNRE